MLVVSVGGAGFGLEQLVGFPLNAPFKIHLMGTGGTPLHSWDLATYTALELPLSGGYAPIVLPGSGGAWTPSALTAGARLTSSILSWTFTTALTVFGWFASYDGTSNVFGGEEFSPAFAFGAGGGLFTWFLPLDLISCPGVSSC